MSGNLILVFYCLGGAVLAAWLFVRFPSLGPHRLSTAVLAALAVILAMSLAGYLVTILVGAVPYGGALALIVVVLPTLTGAFWVASCVMRTLASGSSDLRG